MEAWLDEHGALVDYSETALAPCKDFYHIYVTPKEVLQKREIMLFSLHTYWDTRIEIFTRMWKMFVNNFRTHIPSYHSMISTWTNLYHFFSGIFSVRWRFLFALQFKLLDLRFLSGLVFKKIPKASCLRVKATSENLPATKYFTRSVFVKIHSKP